MYPVILFTYKRVDTLKQVLAALRTQSKPISKLIIFSDGAKANEEDDVQQVRDILHAIDWTDTLVIERETNIGGEANIATGITQVLNEYEQAIIVEDDILPVASFYESMCLLLEHYKDTQSVLSVGGYPSIRNDALPDYPFDIIFSPRFSVWGWAIWADRWAFIEPKLHYFTNPFDNFEQIPTHAGDDLAYMAKEAEEHQGEFYWTDVCLALLSLKYNLRHVHTKHYTTTNIGINIGVHSFAHSLKNTEQFFAEHNQAEDRVPASLPHEGTDFDKIDKAIQDYVKDVETNLSLDSRLSRKNQVKRHINRLWHSIRDWGN